MAQPRTVEDVQAPSGAHDARLDEVLAQSAWFAGLDGALRAEVRGQLSLRNCTAGQSIARQGERTPGLFMVMSGQVQTVGTAIDGMQTLISIQRAGDWSGFISEFDGLHNAFAIVAMEACEIALLPHGKANEIFGTCVERMEQIVRPITHMVRFAFDYLTNTNRRPPLQNVAQRLLDLGRCIYDPFSTPAETLNAVNQDDLAAASYLTRAPVNRALRELQTRGAILLGYGRIEISDADLLNRIAQRGSHMSSRPPSSDASSNSGWSAPVEIGLADSDVNDVLDSSLWFQSLPNTLRNQFKAGLLFKTFEVGMPVYSAGEAGLGLYVQLSGQSKNIGIARDGRDSLAGLMSPGEWAGYLPLLDGQPHPMSLITSQAAIMGLLPKAVCDEIFRADAQNFRALAAPITYVLRYLHDYLVETNRREPARLIAQRLIDLARGSFLPRSTVRALIENLTHTDLAMATGLARPTVTRVCKELSAAGMIEIGYRKLRIVDHDALFRVARGASQ